MVITHLFEDFYMVEINREYCAIGRGIKEAIRNAFIEFNKGV